MKFQTLGFFRANDFGFSSHGRKRIGLGGYEMDLTPFVTRKVIILMVTVTGWERCNPNQVVNMSLPT